MNVRDLMPGGPSTPLPVIVAAAYREAGEEIPTHVKRALGQRDESWSWFAAQMFDLDISTGTRRRLKAAFQWRNSVVREEPAEHKPTRQTADDELHAATPIGFNALLRLLHQRSGVSPAVLAKRAGRELPRSQAYELVKDGRANLPTKLEQVRVFGRACGLPARQIDMLVQLWAELRDGSSTGPSSVLERDLGRLLVRYHKFINSNGDASALKIDLAMLSRAPRGRRIPREGRLRQRRRL